MAFTRIQALTSSMAIMWALDSYGYLYLNSYHSHENVLNEKQLRKDAHHVLRKQSKGRLMFLY